jgi:hypothetical protein
MHGTLDFTARFAPSGGGERWVVSTGPQVAAASRITALVRRPPRSILSTPAVLPPGAEAAIMRPGMKIQVG